MMTRTSNPVDQYRRAQRKREGQKNKTKRIAERDAKVAETKTIASVKTEIDALEKKKTRNDGKLDTHYTQRLERLNKELRIVKDAEEKRRIEVHTRQTADDVAELNDEKFGIYAKCSIYYDAVMNPYGAPPPGKPRLFWTEDGATTIDVKLAAIPANLRSSEDNEMNGNRKQISTQIRPPPRSGPRQHHRQLPPPPPPSIIIQSSTKIDISSLAKRERKRASIWASQEEIQCGLEGESIEERDPTLSVKEHPSLEFTRKRKYQLSDSSDPLCPSAEGYTDYRNTDHFSRAIAHTHSSTKASSSPKAVNYIQSVPMIQWLYRDSMNSIQGPFPSNQMIAWYEAGYFPADTLVCKYNNSHFARIENVNLVTGEDITWNSTMNEVPEEEEQVSQTEFQRTMSNSEVDNEQHFLPADEMPKTEDLNAIPAVGYYPVDDEINFQPSAEMYPVSDLYSYPNTDDAYVDSYYDSDKVVEDNDALLSSEHVSSCERHIQFAKVGSERKKMSWKDEEVVGLVPSHLQIRRHL